MKKIAIVSAAILILYAVFGFFMLPRWLHSEIGEAVSRYTGRAAALGKVSANPFALSVTLRDFTLADRNHERLLAFEELYINFEISSLWRGGYAFSGIRLLSPYLRFLNRADGSMNLQDVLPAAAEPAESRAGETTTIFIDHLLIDHAEIVYEDRQRNTPFVARLDSLNLSLRDFATKPEEEGVYQFEATTDKGEGLQWRGSITVFPFRSAGRLALAGFQARTIWEYIQDRFDFEITGGLADFQADYALDFTREPGVINLSHGSGAVQNLTIVDRRDSSVAVMIPTVSIRGLESEISKSILRIGEIESREAGFSARIWRTAPCR